MCVNVCHVLCWEPHPEEYLFYNPFLLVFQFTSLGELSHGISKSVASSNSERIRRRLVATRARASEVHGVHKSRSPTSPNVPSRELIGVVN